MELFSSYILTNFLILQLINSQIQPEWYWCEPKLSRNRYSYYDFHVWISVLARQRSLPLFKRFESIIYYTFFTQKELFLWETEEWWKYYFTSIYLQQKILGTILGTIVVLPLDKLKDVRRKTDSKISENIFLLI